MVLDQARFAAACETGFVHVVGPDDVDEAVRKAFYLAKLENRPIMLSAPMDVQQMDFDPVEMTAPWGRGGQIERDSSPR